MNRLLMILLALSISLSAWAQEEQKTAPQNWFHLDLTEDGYIGVSSDLAYKKHIKKKKGETIIVAVIDSGIDIEHEDLKDVIWINEAEVANNKEDDDDNGYIDDVYGWSFIGGPEGDVHQDNLEITRLVRKYSSIFADKDTASLSADMKAKYETYQALKAEYTQEYETYSMQAEFYGAISDTFKRIKGELEKEGVSPEDMELDNPRDQMIANMIIKAKAEGEDLDAMVDEIQHAVDYFRNRVDYMLNLDFDPRHIVGDNYEDSQERIYGNNSVTGPDAMHGTHVAGIIAAGRNNNIGIDGIAQNVRIMTIRTVPDGDERDKDVANAIRYAVDNGAKVINMSFGKAHSWDKAVVDDAIKHAIEKDVLMVHAAGNDGANIDYTDNFPNREIIAQANLHDAWIEVGASTYYDDERLPARFSNYGKENVDLFAPGYAIYSTVPFSDYEESQGTSMAAPVVAGIAAMIRSYYPLYSAADVKDIIMRSAVKMEIEVIQPGTEDQKINFSELSRSGAIANLHNALELAKKEYKAKKKATKNKS